MIVYIESNFVLELALEQEQHAACSSILARCKTGKVKLVIPAFSIAEPYQTLGRRFRERKELRERLLRELDLLGRTHSYRATVDTIRELSDLFVTSQDDEDQRLRGSVDRILEVAELIPLDTTVIRQASFRPYGLDALDALVFASVARNMEQADGEKCFLNRNYKDFSDPDLVAFLRTRNCRIFYSFEDADSFLSNQA